MRDLSAAIRNLPPAEHVYDWAPIHMPGLVQGYGVLLVADPESRKIKFVSENCVDLLGLDPRRILDRSFVQLADKDIERRALSETVGPDTILFANPYRMTINGHSCDAVIHNHDGKFLIEVERTVDADDRTYEDLALRAMADLFDPPSVEDLYRRAVSIVRDVTGFDRVLLYRFDERYNGQVIAESRAPGVDSFLGLFFPSSDIGARSRELYLKNFTRYIPDINGKSFELTGVHPGGGKADSSHPVDMTHANLRAVAPCHITYLQNMGVGASMSFSINVDGRLWGLFACHHYAPRPVSYDRRVVCEQTAMMFIFKLAAMTARAAVEEQRRIALDAVVKLVKAGGLLATRLQALTSEAAAFGPVGTDLIAQAIEGLQAEIGWLLPPTDGLDRTGPAARTLTANQKLLLDLTGADSAAVVRHGRVYRIGDAPPEMSVFGIASAFGRELPDIRLGKMRVFATDSLSHLLPAAESIADSAAGILVASLSDTHPVYVMWFRREQVVHATWAGNPNSTAIRETSTGQTPRGSFEAWKQDIRNLSFTWKHDEVLVADELAQLIRNLATAVPEVKPVAPLGGIRPLQPVEKPADAVPDPQRRQRAQPGQIVRISYN